MHNAAFLIVGNTRMDSITFYQLFSVVTFIYIVHLHSKISKLSGQIASMQSDVMWSIEETDKRVREVESATYDIKATVDDMNDFQHGKGSYTYDPHRP